MSEPRHIRTDRSAGRKIKRSDAVQVDTAVSAGENAAPRRSVKKKKSKIRWWMPLLVVLCVVGIAAGVLIGYVNSIMDSVAPPESAASIAEVVQTAPEYKGDVVNILLCGIDYEEGREYGDGGDSLVNDGMTDMILYINYDLKNAKMNMLQIPRNTLVGYKYTCSDTTGKTYKASNGQINSIMLSNEDGLAALADTIANNYKLPVDYYATIDMEALITMVDHFGGIDVYIPQDIPDKKGNVLQQGLRHLDGATVEYLVRQRYAYSDGDLGRLNMQRNFYSALFKRVKTANLAEIVKLMPVVQWYVKTNIPFTDLIALAYNFLSIDSSNILIAQTPMHSGNRYGATDTFDGHSVLVPARAEIADLLNAYFREYTGEIAAEELNLMDSHPHYGAATDPNVQFMGQLDNAAAQAASSQPAA